MTKEKKSLNLSGFRTRGDLSSVQAEIELDKIIYLHPDEIEAPKQVRVTFKRIQELRDTIDAEEQQTPIIVGPRKANGKYELLKGGRRHLAAQIEPVIKLKAVVDAKDYSKIPHEKILSQMVENQAREDLLPHEIGRGYLEARKAAESVGEKLTNAAIAKRTGLSETYVSQYISLASIPDSLAQLIEVGITRDIDLLNSLRVLHGAAPEAYEGFVKRAVEGEPLDRAEVREANRIAKGAVPSKNGDASTGVGEGGSPSNESEQPPKGARADDNTGINETKKLSHANGFDGNEGTESYQEKPPAAADSEPTKTPNRKYQSVAPADILIFVSVANDRDTASGQLITNRVALDPSKAWVSVLNDRGEPQAKLVDVDCIQVVSISTRS